ncbi:response regulator transcription factor [Bordetella sp. BOR01]|uniref:response regulator transcription factor n=1 Tax=Bordetella sp. BOR01 TaxID=2854779 RepID=UPI001C44E6FB|nr:winged helix-turn-helix domain-containing protein [Bordetella sp. BOR01]MBV7485249.1 winged helix-turn-helix domain-containing protein [Bordetella sp. BOR01]
MKQLKVLIMVSDATIRGHSVTTMLQAGIAAEGCGTPLELFNQLSADRFDAVVLDICELGEIGYALLSRLRASPALGIVVIGATLGVESRLRCLQSGADICLPDPLDCRELACVLLALARRLPGRAARVAEEPEIAPEGAGRWELRDQSWTLVSPAGIAISLSANERLVVRTLLDVTGRAVGRAELNQQLETDSNTGRTGGARSIDVIVSRLRRKAELAGVILPIRTVYGSGYLFADR